MLLRIETASQTLPRHDIRPCHQDKDVSCVRLLRFPQAPLAEQATDLCHFAIDFWQLEGE